jgi:hypothetical protein
MKTSELTGNALNWAVGKAEGLDGWLAPVNYCGKWEHGGPIIERELLMIEPVFWTVEGWHWVAYVLGPGNIDENYEQRGPTPLIAAMRCYVASKLGDDVDVPEELV